MLSSVSRGIMATGAIRHSSSRFDNVFFPSVAVLILASVFRGFARTYYLAGVFRAPSPNLLVHIHGAVFSLWILLLITLRSESSMIGRQHGVANLHNFFHRPVARLDCAGMLAFGQSLARGSAETGRSAAPAAAD